MNILFPNSPQPSYILATINVVCSLLRAVIESIKSIFQRSVSNQAPKEPTPLRSTHTVTVAQPESAQAPITRTSFLGKQVLATPNQDPQIKQDVASLWEMINQAITRFPDNPEWCVYPFGICKKALEEVIEELQQQGHKSSFSIVLTIQRATANPKSIPTRKPAAALLRSQAEEQSPAAPPKASPQPGAVLLSSQAEEQSPAAPPKASPQPAAALLSSQAEEQSRVVPIQATPEPLPPTEEQRIAKEIQELQERIKEKMKKPSSDGKWSVIVARGGMSNSPLHEAKGREAVKLVMEELIRKGLKATLSTTEAQWGYDNLWLDIEEQ